MDPVSDILIINPFTWLLLGHFTGDFLFQTRWMAMNKASNMKALVFHGVIYTGFVALFSLFFGGLHFLSYLLIFGVHVTLDKRNLVLWWAKKVTRGTEPWLLIMLDQVLHLFTLVAALYISKSLF